MGISHHITLAHCPWANGSIEVVGRALLCSIRVLLAKWKGVVTGKVGRRLPLINFGLSHMNRPVMGGRTPLEVMTGRKPKSAVDIVLWCGKYLKDAKSISHSKSGPSEGPLGPTRTSPRREMRCTPKSRTRICWDYVSSAPGKRKIILKKERMCSPWATLWWWQARITVWMSSEDPK